MNQLAVSNFVKPYPQDALGGELGLTSLDVAAALGARHEHVKHRMQSLKSSDKAFTEVAVKVPGRGRPLDLLIMPVTEAKMVVAKYDNEIGNCYLRFLIECEKIATELTPKLIAELKEMKAELECLQIKLDGKKVRALKPCKTVLETKEYTAGESMFGDGFIVRRKMHRVPASTLTTLQILEAKRVMLILQTEGTARRIKDISNEIDFRKENEAQLLLAKPTTIKKGLN